MNIEILYSFGPFFTNREWGLKNHSLLLTEKGIVNYRDSIADTLKSHVPFVTDRGEVLRQEIKQSGVIQDVELSALDAVFYPVDGLKEVAIECRWMQNAVVIQLIDGKELVFAYINRHLTDEYRRAFRSLYPSIYKEKGFPKSSLGRLFKTC